MLEFESARLVEGEGERQTDLPEVADRLVLAPSSATPCTISDGKIMDYILAILEVTHKEVTGNGQAARLHLARAIALLRSERHALNIALNIGGPSGNGGLAPWKRRLVLTYIEENLASPIRLADLAAVAQLSLGQFSREFKRSFRETPHAYVIYRRIVRSMQMILENNETLSHIAIACGFSDQAHLCRMFRSIRGVSPTQWRRGWGDESKQSAKMAHRQDAPTPFADFHE